MPEQWYYSRSGQKFGPLSTEQLRQLAATRQLTPTDLLWKEGMTSWTAARSVHEVFPADALDLQTTGRRASPPPIPISSAPGHVSPVGEMSGRRPPPPLRPAGYDLDRDKSALSPPEPPPLAQGIPPLPPSSGISAALKPGQLLDNFIVTKKLGEGGMGVVYKATDQETEVEKAIKVLTPTLCADPRALADLKKEVAVAESLSHQNLLKINYLRTSGATTYIVMECIDGENLEEYRRRKGGALSADDFRKIAPQVLAGLDYLHDKGVVHLDVKPHNIMLTRAFEVKIADYGIARTIKEQMQRGALDAAPPGSLCYMAPEQLRGGDALDRRADVYAAGMMFLRLLTERFPFDPTDRESIQRWHLDRGHKIHDTGLPGLTGVLRKALAVHPGDRYSSCLEMLRDLERHQVLSGHSAPSDVVDLPIEQDFESQLVSLANKLQSLQARRVSGFVPWYKEKFKFYFKLNIVGKGPLGLGYALMAAMWLCYGFAWIPAWYLISKLTRDKSMDDKLDAAIAEAETKLRKLRMQELS